MLRNKNLEEKKSSLICFIELKTNYYYKKHNIMSNQNSKKRKDPIINKKDLWNVFDIEINNSLESNTSLPLECMYRSNGNRENCESCESSLAFSAQQNPGVLTNQSVLTSLSDRMVLRCRLASGSAVRFHNVRSLSVPCNKIHPELNNDHT